MDISLIAFDQAVAVLRGYVGVVVTDLSDDQLAAAHEAAARVARLTDVPMAIFAAEIARRSEAARGGGMARKRGHRNAGRLVAKNTGGSTAQALDQIKAGALFGGGDDAAGESAKGREQGQGEGSAHAPRYPYLVAAFASGAVSVAKAALVCRTLDQIDGGDEGIEQSLVDRAIRLSLEDLRQVCAQVVAVWNQQRHEEREQRMRSERYLALRETPDGMVTMSGKLDPASAAPIVAWLDAQVRAGFQARRDLGLGRADAGEAGRLRVDALVDLARHGMRWDRPGSGVSTTVVVRVDLTTLKNGSGLASCDSLSTPLCASQARAMSVDAGYLPMVLGGASLPLDVGRAKRFFKPAQRLAFAERDGGCAFCHAPVAWCDAHHIVPWSRGGRSDLANGVLLCARCHHRIHDDGWQVHASASRVWFTPPANVDPQRRPRPGGKEALFVKVTESRSGPGASPGAGTSSAA